MRQFIWQAIWLAPAEFEWLLFGTCSQQNVGSRSYRPHAASMLWCMMANLDTDLYIKKLMLWWRLIGIDNCILIFSFLAKANSRAIMGHSQQQQQAWSTVGSIQLTGAIQPPLKKIGATTGLTIPVTPCVWTGVAFWSANKLMKRLRAMWRRKQRNVKAR